MRSLAQSSSEGFYQYTCSGMHIVPNRFRQHLSSNDTASLKSRQRQQRRIRFRAELFSFKRFISAFDPIAEETMSERFRRTRHARIYANFAAIHIDICSCSTHVISC